MSNSEYLGSKTKGASEANLLQGCSVKTSSPEDYTREKFLSTRDASKPCPRSRTMSGVVQNRRLKDEAGQSRVELDRISGRYKILRLNTTQFLRFGSTLT